MLYEKEGTGFWVLGPGFGAPYFFKFRCGWWLQPCMLYKTPSKGLQITVIFTHGPQQHKSFYNIYHLTL